MMNQLSLIGSVESRGPRLQAIFLWINACCQHYVLWKLHWKFVDFAFKSNVILIGLDAHEYAFSYNSQTKIFLSCTNTTENKASKSINNTYLDVHISRHVTYSSESTVSTTVQSCLPCCLCTAVSLLTEVRAGAVCSSWCHIFTGL